MPNRFGSSTTLPLSSAPLDGFLKIQWKMEPWSPWEFVVGDSNELKKLSGYPITHGACSQGIEVTLNAGQNSCRAAFHGYADKASGGRRICVGSRGKSGPAFTEQYRGFLKDFGVDVGVQVDPIPVRLKFLGDNNVYVARR